MLTLSLFSLKNYLVSQPQLFMKLYNVKIVRLYEAAVCVTSIRVTFSSTSAQYTSTNQSVCLFVSANGSQLF